MTRRPALRDPGAQAERTLLAWTRTCTAQAVVGLLVLRLTVEQAPLALAAVLPVLAAALGLHLAARRRYGRLAAGSDQPARALVAAVTVVAVGVAVACGLTVLV